MDIHIARKIDVVYTYQRYQRRLLYHCNLWFVCSFNFLRVSKAQIAVLRKYVKSMWCIWSCNLFRNCTSKSRWKTFQVEKQFSQQFSSKHHHAKNSSLHTAEMISWFCGWRFWSLMIWLKIIDFVELWLFILWRSITLSQSLESSYSN